MRRRAASFVVERRYITYQGKVRWTRWYPQFEVRDMRTDRGMSYSPRQALRQLFRDSAVRWARERTATIKRGMPIGECWRIRLGVRRRP